MSQALRKFLFSSPFLQPFLIEQGQRAEFIKGKAGAEAPGVAFPRGQHLPKRVRKLLDFSLHCKKLLGARRVLSTHCSAAVSEVQQSPVAAEDRKSVTSF